MDSSAQSALRLSLKKKANEEFKMGNIFTANQLYTRVLEEFDPRDKDILSNRSLTYLKMGMHKLALLDSAAVLQTEPSHEKAIVRKIKSLWGLRKYEEAINVIESKLTKAQRELPFYKDLEIKSQKFLNQSKGEYDMCEMIELAKDKLHDIGEYRGPFRVVQIPGKGRGVIATADLSPGQLVLVSKAFVSVLGEECPDMRMITLARTILEKLFHEDDEVRSEFGKLSACDGPDAPLSNWVWSNSDYSKEQGFMIRQVNLRIKDNLFVNHRATPTSCGIWTSASYFNNDCIDANVHIQYFGDVMMMRALNRIKKGQELTVNYFPAEKRTYRRQFMEEGQFKCKCRLCIFEAKESLEMQYNVDLALGSLKMELEDVKEDSQFRRHLETWQLGGMEEFVQTLFPPRDFKSVVPEKGNSQPAAITTTHVVKSLRYFKQFTEMRAEYPSLNVAMFDGAILELSCFLFRSESYRNCAQVLQAARLTLNSAERITSGLLDIDLLLMNCYVKLGDRKNVIKWYNNFMEDLVRAYGTVKLQNTMIKGFFSKFNNLQIISDISL